MKRKRALFLVILLALIGAGGYVYEHARPAPLVLTGIVSATVSVYADGSYSYTGTASALGQVSATARDTWGLNSAAVATWTSCRIRNVPSKTGTRS